MICYFVVIFDQKLDFLEPVLFLDFDVSSLISPRYALNNIISIYLRILGSWDLYADCVGQDLSSQILLDFYLINFFKVQALISSRWWLYSSLLRRKIITLSYKLAYSAKEQILLWSFFLSKYCLPLGIHLRWLYNTLLLFGVPIIILTFI